MSQCLHMLHSHFFFYLEGHRSHPISSNDYLGTNVVGSDPLDNVSLW